MRCSTPSYLRSSILRPCSPLKEGTAEHHPEHRTTLSSPRPSVLSSLSQLLLTLPPTSASPPNLTYLSQPLLTLPSTLSIRSRPLLPVTDATHAPTHLPTPPTSPLCHSFHSHSNLPSPFPPHLPSLQQLPLSPIYPPPIACLPTHPLCHSCYSHSHLTSHPLPSSPHVTRSNVRPTSYSHLSLPPT